MEILKKMNLSDRRNLYVLLGVSIAVLSIGLAFLSNGSRPSSDTIISPTNSTPDNILQSNSSMQENFQLSTDTIPGNTDEYDARSIRVYLESDQELNVSFRTEDAPVLVRVYTPSDQVLGYSSGVLEANKSAAAQEGFFIYKAVESGTHDIYLKSSSPTGFIDVFVEYWIQ
jgi:hypothetical protein